MMSMRWPRDERYASSSVTTVLRVLTLALMLLVFGTLAAHHADADSIGTTGAETAAVATTAGADVVVHLEVPAAGVAAGVAAGDGWVITILSGCAAMGLCGVLGLALVRRSAAGRPRRPGSTGRIVGATPFLPVLLARASARPSLLLLSVSRT